MSYPYIGEIRVVSFGFAPKGWALCNGQLLPINQNTALFSILGTTYGGDGISTFALPNLQGRVPIHFDDINFYLGQNGGEVSHILTTLEMPAHSHVPTASPNNGDSVGPSGNSWANGGQATYAASPNVAMSPQAIGPNLGGQPHENRSPYLTLNFVIALTGIFPSRN